MTGRRVHERYECDLPAVLVWDDQEHHATVSNISLGGIFLLTDLSVPFGAPVIVRLRLPALKEEASFKMTVRWTRPDGVGFQFGSLRAIEVWGLNQYFKGLTVSPET